MIGESEVGESCTTQWRIGALDPNSTIAFFFEVAAEGGNNGPGQQMSPAQMHSQQGGYGQMMQHQMEPRYAFLQFQTLYHHPSGARRLRVTTVARPLTTDSTALASGFDQESAACLITRHALSQVESGVDLQDVYRRLDRVLIRVISRFASYNKDDVGSKGF